jgi:hypothetical protein
MADRLEPPRRPIRQPGGAPLVRLGGRWWRREDLEPLPSDDGAASGDVQLLP